MDDNPLQLFKLCNAGKFSAASYTFEHLLPAAPSTMATPAPTHIRVRNTRH
jgi:hypothetical protein